MAIAFYADIHYRAAGPPNYWTPPADLDVEAIVLGGDIHYSPEHLAAMLKAIRATQPAETSIVFVPGNGEYAYEEMNGKRDRYRIAVESVPNSIMLDNDVFTLGSGVRIIGSTLWSFVDEEWLAPCTKVLEKYGLQGVDDIRLGDRFLTFEDTNLFHLEARGFIEHELRTLSAAERRNTVVCTHFWPTMRWMESKDENGTGWQQTIGTDLDEMIAAYGPRYWLCGHLHRTKYVTVGETEIVANPMAGETADGFNAQFSDSLVIRLD